MLLIVTRLLPDVKLTLPPETLHLAWLDGFRTGVVCAALACGALALAVLFLRR